MTTIFRNRSIPPRYYRRVLQLLICWLILCPTSSKADFLVGPEYEVKMGFIFNFANFVTWPDEAFDSSGESLLFCFASDHPAANVLFQLNDQSIQGRRLEVRKIESEIGSEKCHILFFGTDSKSFIRSGLTAIRGQHILTIGEIDGFAQMGGVINFFDQTNKLRFEVNIDAAKRENLKFSAQILQSAQRIVNETEADRQAQQAEIKKQAQKQPSTPQEVRPEENEKTNKPDPPDNTGEAAPFDELENKSGTDGKVGE